MAGGQERILRRRIKSVQSTKKITRAMELIASSRIVRAMGRISSARPYYEQLSEVVRDLAAGSSLPKSRYLGQGDESKVLGLVVMVADRGLCGGYNSTALRMAERLIRSREAQGLKTRVVVVGRKGEAYFRYREIPVEGSLMHISDRPSYQDARKIAEMILAPFEAGEISAVDVISTRFLSAGTQKLEKSRLAPIDPDIFASDSKTSYDFEYEPSPEVIIDPLLKQFVESKIFALLLEASASELAAKQRAMAAATENAEELIKSLSRVMNRARQDAITTEIMEIVGGAEALGSSSDWESESQLVEFKNNSPKAS